MKGWHNQYSDLPSSFSPFGVKSSVDNEGENVLTESYKAARWLEVRRHPRAKSVNDAKATYIFAFLRLARIAARDTRDVERREKNVTFSVYSPAKSRLYCPLTRKNFKWNVRCRFRTNCTCLRSYVRQN